MHIILLQPSSYSQGSSFASAPGQQGKMGRVRAGVNADGVSLAGVRSLSANLKYPYKRTISAPTGMGLSQKGASGHVRGTLSEQISTTSGPGSVSYVIPGSSNVGGGGSGGQSTPSASHRQQSAPILRGKMSKESSHVLSKQGI